MIVRSPDDIALALSQAFEEDWLVLRLAELLQTGERAKVRVTWQEEEKQTLFLLSIQRADGTLEYPP